MIHIRSPEEIYGLYKDAISMAENPGYWLKYKRIAIKLATELQYQSDSRYWKYRLEADLLPYPIEVLKNNLGVW